mgnify:CR=1 FL=1
MLELLGAEVYDASYHWRIDNPTSGQVIVDGQNLSHMTDEELTIFRRRNIGFVFQQYNLVPMLNVWEILFFL